MNENLKSLTRGLLFTAAGYLLASGKLSEADMEAIVGGLTALISAVWVIIKNKNVKN